MPADTKDRILDAAERLFGARGYAGTSLRSITSAAKANLAAVNYHFRTKEALFAAVLARRHDPLNRERLALLEACLEAAAPDPPPLDDVLRAFIAPVLRVVREADADGQACARLIMRVDPEVAPLMERIVTEQFGEVAQRFRETFERCLPRLPPLEIAWRMHFCIGAMAGVMLDTFRLRAISEGQADSSDVEGTLRRLIPFVAAGMREPPAPSGGEA